MPAPALIVQTTYAELLERCAATSFEDAFREDGTFTPKTIKGRRYWYFQSGTAQGRSQRYVGPESPELLERIAHHKERRDDERERRALVSTLVRSFGLPSPVPQLGDIIAALAGAGIFRLRSVLVGTVAYQCYAGMLGLRLPGALVQTSDIDVAQFTNVSVAIGDQTPPMLQVLQGVEKSFREIPHTSDSRLTSSYVAKGGLRVDFLTPNEGPESDRPQTLPALQTDAQPLRFLDFLIHEPEQAVVLHGPGIHVRVPGPERYAVHKLIISMRRRAGVAKRDKDLQQVEVLIAALAERRAHEFRRVWEEAHHRGPKWRKHLLEGMTRIAPQARDLMLKTLERPREILPGLDLTFNNPPARYDSHRDVVAFTGEALGSLVSCAISGEALADYFGADGLDKEERVEAFLKNRSAIERLVRVKYLSGPVEDIEAVLLGTMDVEKLRPRT
ncbi:MAG TPA: GSU2403 family nucleotidyltransferase fold protein [Steroidobacteraceae bacterium]|jgi:hypothetical protein